MHFAGIGSQVLADRWLDPLLHPGHESTSHIMAQTMHNHVMIGADPCVRFDSDLSL
jgi:hypothetical protein